MLHFLIKVHYLITFLVNDSECTEPHKVHFLYDSEFYVLNILRDSFPTVWLPRIEVRAFGWADNVVRELKLQLRKIVVFCHSNSCQTVLLKVQVPL